MDCIISTVTMSYNATNEVYTLDRIDVEKLEKFVTLGEYSCTLVMHMVYDNLAVDMIVYDMQV